MRARARLAMSEDAARLVCSLADDSELPAGSGLRISLNPATDSMSMVMTTVAEPADFTVTRDGATVFLSAGAMKRTNGRTLCATITAADSTFFLDP
jgi:Fe-S cluster assembly iron-binding protein IscA